MDRADRAPVAIRGVLFDLLMAVMNSVAVWTSVAGDPLRGLAWRDAVTARMAAAGTYVPYEALVAEAADEVNLPSVATRQLFARWPAMEAWPDAQAITDLSMPYAFVTNCSTKLATLTAERSGLHPRFTLSAEDAGCFKPTAQIYHEGCRRLGFPPHETAFVAGSPYDAAGARAAGLQTWLVVRRSCDDQRSSQHPVRIATSLHAVVAEIGQGYSRR
jgi:2-haloacid dehalogenase